MWRCAIAYDIILYISSGLKNIRSDEIWKSLKLLKISIRVEFVPGGAGKRVAYGFYFCE